MNLKLPKTISQTHFSFIRDSSCRWNDKLMLFRATAKNLILVSQEIPPNVGMTQRRVIEKESEESHCHSERKRRISF